MPPDVEWVTCGYCRVSSFVQRSRAHPPAPSAVPAGTPVIHVRQSRGVVWILLALVALATVIAGFVASDQKEPVETFAVLVPPLLFDVNDDGAEDALIVARTTGGPACHLRALDANTGATLWKTDDLAVDAEQAAVVDDAVLWITASKFRGFDARTGAQRFVRDLPEHVRGVCEVGGSWLLLTADKKAYSVDVATGELTERATPRELAAASIEVACSPASSTFASFGRRIRFESWTALQVEGMTTSSILHFGADTLPELVLGRRAQGSALPMLAGVRDGRTLWKLELPSTAPLEVETGDPRAATIAAARVYASYQRTSTPGFTVVGVMLSNGERQWEAAMSRKRNASVSLRASDHHVFARADTSLYALSASDGRLLWRIGWDPDFE